MKIALFLAVVAFIWFIFARFIILTRKHYKKVCSNDTRRQCPCFDCDDFNCGSSGPPIKHFCIIEEAFAGEGYCKGRIGRISIF